jgi:hypothetical protein
LINHDLRQLSKIRQQIAFYNAGNLSLNSLIQDLMFLRDSLSSVDQEWEREFTNCVVNLESAYSYALEKSAGKLDEIAQKIVDDTIPILLSLTTR